MAEVNLRYSGRRYPVTLHLMREADRYGGEAFVLGGRAFDK